MPGHVNLEEEWVFIHVPKTGGTSMERVLDIRGTMHLTAKAQRGKHPEYFLWGFVRHPCDRILSAYYYECRAERKPVCFEGLRAYVKSPPKKLHTIPQSEFTHESDRLLLDFVGRFESINRDFKILCDRLRIPSVTLPVANRTEHPPWTELFTTDMMRQTQRNFSADFELFDYDPFTPPAESAGNQESHTEPTISGVRKLSWKGTIPIYINNYNWLTWPQALAEFFADIPQTEVIFVDNASTYPPLLDWYENECPFKVIRLDTNSGPYAAWKKGAILPSHIHRGLFGSEYYVVTDPDLSLEGCPKDVLERLIDGIERFPTANKVGLSLENENLPENSLLGMEAIRWEQKFWRNRFDDQFYKAAIDTTFALYSINTPQRKAMQNNQNALRSDRPYTARHLPWDLRPDNLSEEQLYYFESTQNGMWSRKIGQKLRSLVPSTVPSAVESHENELFGLSESDINCFEPDWRISKEMLLILGELLRLIQPDSILETGAGVSSLLFYHYLQSKPQTVYRSHDQSGRWNDRFLSHVRRLGFPTSNITSSPIRDEFYERIAPDAVAHRPFDLIVFDGPSALRHRASDRGRAFLKENGASSSIYVLDDTNWPAIRALRNYLEEQFGTESFQAYEVRDRSYNWRVSTILLPQEKVDLLHQSKLWAELAQRS